jgi:hypothetical protein
MRYTRHSDQERRIQHTTLHVPDTCTYKLDIEHAVHPALRSRKTHTAHYTTCPRHMHIQTRHRACGTPGTPIKKDAYSALHYMSQTHAHTKAQLNLLVDPSIRPLASLAKIHVNWVHVDHKITCHDSRPTNNI